MERLSVIEGFENYYISDIGNVYSNNLYAHKELKKLKLKGVNNENRYISVTLCKNNIKKYAQVHRLVAFAFCDGYTEGAVVNHIDSNKHNNCYTNLEWVTQKENVHKSYITSGMNQIRNYKYFKLLSPTDKVIGIFKGRNKAVEYVKENNIDASGSSLIRHGFSRGYKLILDK